MSKIILEKIYTGEQTLPIYDALGFRKPRRDELGVCYLETDDWYAVKVAGYGRAITLKTFNAGRIEITDRNIGEHTLLKVRVLPRPDDSLFVVRKKLDDDLLPTGAALRLHSYPPYVDAQYVRSTARIVTVVLKRLRPNALHRFLPLTL